MDDAAAFGGVTDDRSRRRFELVEQGLTAFATYHLDGETVVIPHVEAPIPLRGQGTAGRLMAGMLDRIRAEGRRVRPTCPYAAAYIRRHPEYADLLS